MSQKIIKSKVYLITLKVQVPHNHILTQNLYYNPYYPYPKYLIIGYMDPLGNDKPSALTAHPQTLTDSMTRVIPQKQVHPSKVSGRWDVNSSVEELKDI